MTRSVYTYARRGILLVALVLAPVASLQAQPPGPPGGPPLAAILLDDVLHAQLDLTPMQEALWTTLDAHDAALHTQMQSARDAAQALIATELAKTTPDLVLIDTVRASSRDAIAAAAKQVDADAIALYVGLDATQQAAVIAFVKAFEAQVASHGAPPEVRK